MIDELEQEETINVNEPAPADDSPEAGIESLRQQIADATRRAEDAEAGRQREQQARQSESQAREEAERRVRQANEENVSTRRNAADAQYDSVVNALAAAESELVNTKAAYKVALSEGDFERAADLSGDIGMAATKVREFQAGKSVLEQRRQAGDQQQQQQQPSDGREAYIQTMPPRTAAWLRRNDRFFTDGNFQKMIQGAHALALGKGMQFESDEYFEYIEEQSGLRQPAQQTQAAAPTTAASATTQRHSAPAMAAAPPAGSTASTSRTSSTTITLTAEERDLCRTTGISEAAYAKQKRTLIDEGLINSGARR